MEIVTIEGEKFIKERKLAITTLVDGNPFDLKWSTVPCDETLSLEEATDLATKLFGKFAIITEQIKLQKTTKVPIGKQL